MTRNFKMRTSSVQNLFRYYDLENSQNEQVPLKYMTQRNGMFP